MIVKSLDSINAEIEKRERERKLRKFLPILLFLSFVWVELFESVSFVLTDPSLFVDGFNSVFMNVLSVLITCLISYIMFELSFYFYKLLIGFSIYMKTIPKTLFENKARLFVIYRNMVLGLFLNLLFLMPYLVNFMLIIQIIIDFVMFGFFFYNVTHETVSVVIYPNVFKTLFYSFVFFEAVDLFIIVLGVL